MRHKLLLLLLNTRPRSSRSRGFTMVAGMLVILALLVGTLGLVAIVTGGNLAAFFSGEARDSDQIAEAGADLIINTFNQPENRKLLVAGSIPPNGWSTSNQNLQSPCLSSMGVRPGTGGTGLPSSKAINISDGQIRNLGNPDALDGDRRFRLVAVRYSTGTSGSSDRKSVSKTYDIGNKVLLKEIGALNGSSFDQLVNLDRDSNFSAGTNTGSIAVTVEGRLYKAGTETLISTSTITKEYEVVPKCCGGSFGSNGSGGTAPSNSLGAAPRYCSIDYGLIIGINGGRLWSNEADDYFSTVNAVTKDAEPIRAILGIVGRDANGTDNPWNRAKIDTSIKIADISMQAGCRTEPSPCNTSLDYPESDPINRTPNPTNINLYIDLTNASPQPSGILSPKDCSSSSSPYGDSSSWLGSAASCTPIAPLYLSTGLPSIDTFYSYNWLPGLNPDNVSKQTVFTTTSQQYYKATDYPYGEAITALGYPYFETNYDNEATFRLRVNPYKTDVNGKPMLEYCKTKYLPDNKCVSSNTDRGRNTWAQISSSSKDDYPVGGISDDFHTGTLDGWTAGSSPRWPTPWEVNDPGSISALIGLNNVQFNTGSVTFQNPNNDDWTSSGNDYSNVPAIARAFNFYALKDPLLVINFKLAGVATDTTYKSKAALYLDYSLNNGPVSHGSPYYWTNWTTLSGISAPANTTCFEISPNTFRCEIYLPFPTYLTNPNSHYVKWRLRATNNYGTDAGKINSLSLTKVSVTSRKSKGTAHNLPWCEYSSTFPITNTFTGGFHCLGPTVNLTGVNNILYVDPSYDQLSKTNTSISFYYNSVNDKRGYTIAKPLINLTDGGRVSSTSLAIQAIRDLMIA